MELGHADQRSRMFVLLKYFFALVVLTLILPLLFRGIELPRFVMYFLYVMVMCLNAIFLISLAIAMFSNPVRAVRHWFRQRSSDMLLPPIVWKEHFPVKSAACFILSGLLAMSFSNIMESSARNQVLRLLGQASEDTAVRIKGKDVNSPGEVIHELNKIKKISAHHSHATKKFQVEIISGGNKLVLEVGRDSSRAYEYWVFYPHYRYTGEMHIGSIVTDIFDDY